MSYLITSLLFLLYFVILSAARFSFDHHARYELSGNKLSSPIHINVSDGQLAWINSSIVLTCLFYHLLQLTLNDYTYTQNRIVLTANWWDHFGIGVFNMKISSFVVAHAANVCNSISCFSYVTNWPVRMNEMLWRLAAEYCSCLVLFAVLLSNWETFQANTFSQHYSIWKCASRWTKKGGYI